RLRRVHRAPEVVVQREPAPAEHRDVAALRVTLDGGGQPREIPRGIEVTVVRADPDGEQERHRRERPPHEHAARHRVEAPGQRGRWLAISRMTRNETRNHASSRRTIGPRRRRTAAASTSGSTSVHGRHITAVSINRLTIRGRPTYQRIQSSQITASANVWPPSVRNGTTHVSVTSANASAPPGCQRYRRPRGPCSLQSQTPPIKSGSSPTGPLA